MSRVRSAALLLVGQCATVAFADESSFDTFRTTTRHELSAGATLRVTGRDPGLIGGGSGGTGTSANYDDGSLNYGRGLTALGVQGRSTVEGHGDSAELKLEVVYFYDIISARGGMDHRALGDEARDRAAHDVYLNEAYVGFKGRVSDAAFGLRLGNDIVRWSDSRAFGYSIAPVNPVAASRRYQPGNAPAHSTVALPMLSARLETASKWGLEAFYLLGFKPSEMEAAGTFLSPNDFYSPGGQFLLLDTPFGSRVPRVGDRKPGSGGQFGGRVVTPEMGEAKIALAGYAMRVHTREPLVSVNTGTLGGLLRVSAPDYTSSGSYFVEYPARVDVFGASLRASPAAYTRLGADYSIRRGQPLQIDDDLLITAGLAPAAALGACSPNPASALCAGTLAVLNRNPLIAARGGITAGNAATVMATEISGYERFDVSQYSASLQQGLPPMLGAAQGVFAGEVGGLRIHGFRENFIDAMVSVRPDASGARRVGLATRSSWGYRLYGRLDYTEVAGMRSVSPSIAWIHDPKGKSPITIGTLLEGTRSAILAIDFGIAESLDARVSWRSFLNRGNDADRFSDRDFVSLSITRRF